VSLGKNILYTFLTQIPVVILSVVTGVFITRYLGVEYKGIFSFFESDIILLTLFTGFGMDTAITYYLSKKQHDISKVLGASVLVLVTTIIFLLLLLFILLKINPSNPLFPTSYNSSFYYFYLFLAVVFSLLNSYFSAIFRGLKEFKIVNRILLINTIVSLSLFSCLFFSEYFFNGFSKLQNVLLVKLILLFILNLIWVVVYLKKVNASISFNIDKALLKGIFGFISIIYLADLLNFFNYRLDLYFIEFYLTEIDLSYYSLAVNIAQFFWIFTASLTTVLQPSLNDPNEKKVLSKFVFYSRLNFTVILIGCIVLYFTAGWIIPLVYGKDFSGTVVVLQVLLPAILVGSISKMFAFMVVNKGFIRYNLYAVIFGLIITILLNVILIPVYGIIGASISSLFSYLVIAITVYLCVIKKVRYPNANYFFLTFNDIKKRL
jgi:O-antigen/teichoic acid export membrane protein